MGSVGFCADPGMADGEEGRGEEVMTNDSSSNVVTFIQHGEYLRIHTVMPCDVGKVNEFGKTILRTETCLDCVNCGKKSHKRSYCNLSHKEGYYVRGTVCAKYMGA